MEHLIEGFSDSNFANDRTTRKSLSLGQIFVGQAIAYSFVRGQKVVTLSSGEAELVALTQTTSESILVKKAWEFLVREPTALVMRSNSSVARAIASRPGVGRVRHLQTSCLWVQQWVAQHLLKVLPVPTEFNPADIGTKCFTARRLRLLCYLVGMVEDNGDHVGHNEFREALARRAGTQDRNRELLVRLVQPLAATSLQGCEFSPASPDNFFEDAAALIYFTILVFMRYLWLVILVLVVWTVARGVGSNDREANPRTHKDKGKTEDHNHERDIKSHGQEQETEDNDSQDSESEDQDANNHVPDETTHSNLPEQVLGGEPQGGTPLDIAVAARIQAWLAENALPMFIAGAPSQGLEPAAVANTSEARPSGATTSSSSWAPPPAAAAITSSATTREGEPGT